MQAKLFAAVFSLTLLTSCTSDEIQGCNSDEVKNTILNLTVESLKKAMLAGLDVVKPTGNGGDTPADRQALRETVNGWTAKIANVRQIDYDKANNARTCVAEFKHVNKPNPFAIISLTYLAARGAIASNIKVQAACDGAIRYKIERQLDRPKDFYVSWNCQS